MQANLASASLAHGCLIAGMSNAFSELIERAGSEQPLTRDEIHTLLVDGEGQDFALIEAASILRRNEFRNMIAVHTENEELADALGTRSIAVDSYDVLDISRDIDSEELAETIERIAASPAIGVTVLLPKNAVPMMLMRVLSILRLAAPSKVIHLPEGYDQSLRSLTSLAMHVVSAITITDDIEQWPMVNEILKSLRHGGIVISGTGGRDALAGYLRYLSDLGVDLMGHRDARGSACGSVRRWRLWLWLGSAAVATRSRHLPPVVAVAARADAVPPLKLRLKLTATPTVMAVAAAATTSRRKKRVVAAAATTSPSRSWRKLPLAVAAAVLVGAALSNPLEVATPSNIFQK